MNNIRTNREFILNLYLYFNPSVIGDLIGYNIDNVKLESNYNGRKIDILADSNQKKVFIETQITKSDDTHLNQIKFIIDNVDANSHTVIIWIANSFHELMLDNIVEYIRDSGKNIEFVAIDLVSNVDSILETLQEFGEFGIVENLWRLDDVIELDVVSKYYRKTNTNIVSENSIQEENKNEKEIIMEKILEEIIRQLFYFTNVHREKKMDGNVIVLGSGYGEINYLVCLNRYNNLTIELRFNNNTKEIFDKLLKHKEDIEEVMDFVIDWDYQLFRIYSEQAYQGGESNKDRIIRQQVRVLEKLINYFTKFMTTI